MVLKPQARQRAFVIFDHAFSAEIECSSCEECDSTDFAVNVSARLAELTGYARACSVAKGSVVVGYDTAVMVEFDAISIHFAGWMTVAFSGPGSAPAGLAAGGGSDGDGDGDGDGSNAAASSGHAVAVAAAVLVCSAGVLWAVRRARRLAASESGGGDGNDEEEQKKGICFVQGGHPSFGDGEEGEGTVHVSKRANVLNVACV